MDENKIKIKSFLSRFFRAEAISEDDDFFAQGFVNSLFAMQLVMWVEKEFGFPIEDEDLDIQNFNTVNAIAAFVERKTLAGVAV
jgi:methoxymalonate biosynthesis acyl carrier protein